MNGTQRLSQENKLYKNGGSCILEQAESISRGVLKSIQAVAGTTDCKRVQVFQLEKWAKEKRLWIDIDKIGSFEDRGSENEVYLSYKENVVFKLNDFRYSDDITCHADGSHEEPRCLPSALAAIALYGKKGRSDDCAATEEKARSNKRNKNGI